MEAVIPQRMFTISVPQIDTKRFKGIVKAMGWVVSPVPQQKEFDIMKTSGFKEAMDDVKHGRVTHYASAEDMFRDLKIKI